MSEQQLLQAIHRGDKEAKRDLYCCLAPQAMAVAMRYVADEDAARDILQDSFVKVLTRISSFEYRGEGSLRHWVLSIVSHQAIDWLKDHRRTELTAQLPELIDEADDAPPGIETIPLEALQHMIESLPTGYRTVFILFVFDHKSHKEIARLLGIRENTSASQFHRARRLLAKMINDYQTEYETGLD